MAIVCQSAARLAYFVMKRLFIPIIVFAAASAFAQVHGVPASVTSPTPNNPFPGPAASVTSPGPNGFGGQAVVFPVAVAPVTSGHRHHRIPARAEAVAVPVYVPVGAYEDGVAPPEEPPAVKPAATAAANDEGKTKVVVVEGDTLDALVEKRLAAALEKLAADRAAPSASPSAPKAADASVAGQVKNAAGAPESSATEEQLASTLFVMRDGSQRELHNYAIMDGALYDLADGGMKKIPLDSVDLDATRKANEAAGKSFRMP